MMMMMMTHARSAARTVHNLYCLYHIISGSMLVVKMILIELEC